MKSQPKLVNSQHRVSGTLCDPTSLIEVLFSIFVNELSSFPKEGAVIAIHNVKIISNERMTTLEGIRSSYVVL